MAITQGQYKKGGCWTKVIVKRGSKACLASQTVTVSQMDLALVIEAQEYED